MLWKDRAYYHTTERHVGCRGGGGGRRKGEKGGREEGVEDVKAKN